jgi:hypothetical protein
MIVPLARLLRSSWNGLRLYILNLLWNNYLALSI